MFNAAAASHLPAQIPARPLLSLDIFGGESAACGSILDAAHQITTLNARTALAHALQHAKIGQGDSVLVPALHCPSMVSPLAWLQIKPIFYPIRPDTSVDIEVLSNYLQPGVRALIAVHYFGFIQNLKPLRAFCDRHGLILIEDCAHTFFGSIDGQSVGQQGDYAIASIMKFLPIDQGGCLISARHSLAEVKTRTGSLFFQLKSAINTIELACEYGRLPWLTPVLQAKSWLWHILKNKPEQTTPAVSQASDCVETWNEADYVFDASTLGISMSAVASTIMRHMSFSRACTRRRLNYQRLLAAFSDMAGGRPLFTELPAGVFPQVFPLLVEQPETAFAALKQKGVPIIRFGEYRWPGVDASICPVSQDYSRRIFQFTCHQSLTTQEVDWLIATVREVLAKPPMAIS